jgi:hypothetical protein
MVRLTKHIGLQLASFFPPDTDSFFSTHASSSSKETIA